MEQTSLHIFNPWHDLALANNHPNYQPPASAMRLAQELELLPAWIASPGDFLWNEGRLYRLEAPADLQERLAHCVPVSPSELPVQNLQVCPWGWDLLVYRKLKAWNCSLDLPDSRQLETWRQLSSRALAVQVLERLSEAGIPDCTGKSFLCTEVQQVGEWLEAYGDVFVKQLWSSSGKGLRPVALGEFGEPLRNWCARNIRLHGGIVVEPRYHRTLDFAMEFEVSGQQATFLGYSVFFTDINGHYTGNLLASDAQLEERIATAMGQDNPGVLHVIRQKLIELLNELVAPFYQGPLGVDMMVVASDSGELLVHPCVEINLRFNMGQLATRLYQRYVETGVLGRFSLDYFPTPEALQRNHERLQAEHPLCLHEGRISSGCLALNPLRETTQYRATVCIGL